MAATGGCCASLMALPCISSLMGGGCGGGGTTCALGATCENICNFFSCCNKGNCCVTVGPAASFAPSDVTNITTNPGGIAGAGVGADAAKTNNAANRALEIAQEAAAASNGSMGVLPLGTTHAVTPVVMQQPASTSVPAVVSV